MVTYKNRAFRGIIWYFIGVYIINRILHGRLEKRNFSSLVEKFHSFAALTREIFQHLKRNFVSPRGHVISSLCTKTVDSVERAF